MKFVVRAPSNIALIKYMGKTDSVSNLPENGSLSVTLNDLCTYAEAEFGGDRDRWFAESPARAKGFSAPRLSDEGAAKVLRHVERVRGESPAIFSRFGLRSRLSARPFMLRTANTFPEASGIASSASSFAAITLVTALACAESPEEFERAWKSETGLRRDFAKISRQGSGSSCRSFEGPYVKWEGESAARVETDLGGLAHFVVVVSESAKAVSSSRAHGLVKTSPLWNGRVARVEQRLRDLTKILGDRTESKTSRLSKIAKISWSEAWEMHSLFHTCSEPFSYWQPQTIEVLHSLASALAEPAPPIVTLDAGPNVHVLVDVAQADAWRKRLRENFPTARLLEDRPGAGAEILEILG